MKLKTLILASIACAAMTACSDIERPGSNISRPDSNSGKYTVTYKATLENTSDYELEVEYTTGGVNRTRETVKGGTFTKTMNFKKGAAATIIAKAKRKGSSSKRTRVTTEIVINGKTVDSNDGDYASSSGYVVGEK